MFSEKQPPPSFFTSPVSISRSVCWQVTLSCLCSVELVVGTHSWHAVHLFEGALGKTFLPEVWELHCFALPPLCPPPPIQDIFPHIQVTVCVLPSYHRYTHDTDGESTLICCCDISTDPDGLYLRVFEYTCMKTIVTRHVSQTGVWGRIVKCDTFIGCLFFLYPLLFLIYNVVKEVILQLQKRRLKGC